jgi:hypothetical protein
MKSAFPALVACVAGLALASSAPGQNPYVAGSPSVARASMSPDAGYAQVVGGQVAAPPVTPTVVIPQPAEQLGQSAGSAGPWIVVEPYAWIFGMRGMVKAHGVAAPVDLTVSDAIDNISDLKGAAMLHVETGYDSVGLITDVEYLKVIPADGLVRVESEATLAELVGMYRVCGNRCRQAGSSYFDVLAGVRYYRFSHSIALAEPVPIATEHTSSWVDWIFGARAGVQILDGLGVFARADVGGFGIGNGSHRACNILTGLEYQCCDCASLIAGYRWLKIDRSAGTGFDAFGMNVTLAGPFVGFGLYY